MYIFIYRCCFIYVKKLPHVRINTDMRKIVILQLDIHGKLIKIHQSLRVAEMEGISRRTLTRVLQRTSGMRMVGGYCWAYRSEFSIEQLAHMIRESSI